MNDPHDQHAYYQRLWICAARVAVAAKHVSELSRDALTNADGRAVRELPAAELALAEANAKYNAAVTAAQPAPVATVGGVA